MKWANPEYAALAIVVILCGIWYWRALRKKQPSLQASFAGALRSVHRGGRARWIELPALMKFIGLGLLIVALCRPQSSTSRVNRSVDGIDIVISLDISDSMLIEDMTPENRLESAKETIRQFISRRVSDRIGLVVFAGEAFTIVPPTLDYQLLLERLKSIGTANQTSVREGTAIGVGLATAAARLRDSQAKSKVIIFLTDGENNAGAIDPNSGLEIAKGYGLKIYTIGIGRDGKTKLPIMTRDFFGNVVKSYQPFESYVNTELLKKFADETGGKFYRASEGDRLSEIFAEINKLEKIKVDDNRYTSLKEEFSRWVLAAIVILTLSFVLEYTWLRRQPL